MLATRAGGSRGMNWIALPAVVLIGAIIFAGATALDYRRQRAAGPAAESE